MDDGQLTTKQAQLVELLLSGLTIVAAAKQLKCNESTCRRWLKLPHVQSELRSARRRLYEERMAMVIDGVGIAQRTLLASMDAAKTRSEFVRMSAAAKWLDIADKAIVDNYREQRLSELEDALRKAGLLK